MKLYKYDKKGGKFYRVPPALAGLVSPTSVGKSALVQREVNYERKFGRD